MKKTFKKGDFVRIGQGTHDPYMPDSRCGILLEQLQHTDDRQPTRPNRGTGVWNVFMTNGAELRFHEMFLEHVYDEEIEPNTEQERTEL